jgi:Helix-turn-helix domain
VTGDVIVIESESSEPGQSRLVDCVPADDLAEAKRRLAIIKPLVRSARRTDADVRKVAAEQGVSRATVYGWLNAFRTRDIVTRIHGMAEGLTGETCKLLTMAAEMAVRNGRELIDMATLDEVPWVVPSERRRVAK